MLKKHVLQIDRICLTRKPKFAGIFELRNPILMINDPELIKQITVKDFDYFVNHRGVLEPEIEPMLGYSLFTLTDQKWKDMRAMLSPAFTGSKMRQIFQLVEECCQNVKEYFKDQTTIDGLKEVDLKEFFARFTNDVIASSAFGLKIDSLTDKNNEFYKMGRMAMDLAGVFTVKFFLFANFSALMKFFRIKIFDQKFTSYFHKLVLDTMKYRSERGIIRHDMINLLMQARKGVFEASEMAESDDRHEFATGHHTSLGQKPVHRNWSDSEIVAQCFLFFLAGFETTATMMCFCAHELMENPDVQAKLFAEVEEVREELNGKPLTYEILQKMKYMDMVVSETLRKWPGGVALDRVCSKPYKLIDSAMNQVVELNPGDFLWIPIVGLHYNPDFFPNPNKFEPERFSNENKDKIKPFTYLPFGSGPRYCIATRFALMETKAIIFHLLSEFTFEASPKTSSPITLAKTGFLFIPENGFWLRFKPRIQYHT